MRVLVAEDDTSSRLILEAAIRPLGHECVAVANGTQAWELFERSHIDAIISDRVMPGLNGIELCRRVRASGRHTYTYFIFLTVLDEKPQIITGMEAGADDYLVKPLDPDELKMRLLVAERVTALHGQLSRQSAELARLNRQLLEQSRTDPLTSLGSRLKLNEDLEAIGARAARYGNTFCAIMCDVDHFKAYNDHYGHIAGDKVLRTVAQALKATCRGSDQAYRYGGEEFLILLPEQALDTGLVAAERFRRAIEGLAIPHDANPVKPIVTISAGVAPLWSPQTTSMETWLSEADGALYRAKQLGRNRVAPCEMPLAALETRATS